MEPREDTKRCWRRLEVNSCCRRRCTVCTGRQRHQNTCTTDRQTDKASVLVRQLRYLPTRRSTLAYSDIGRRRSEMTRSVAWQTRSSSWLAPGYLHRCRRSTACRSWMCTDTRSNSLRSSKTDALQPWLDSEEVTYEWRHFRCLSSLACRLMVSSRSPAVSIRRRNRQRSLENWHSRSISSLSMSATRSHKPEMTRRNVSADTEMT